MTRCHRLLLPVALLLIAAAGCGDTDSDDGSSSAVTAVLARAGYIERADRVCEQARAALEDAAGSAFSGLGRGEQPSRARVTAFVDRRVTPLIGDALEDLSRLQPPVGDRRRIDAILAAARAASAELAADPRLVIDRARDPFGDANRRARAYGFRSCGSINPSALACAVSDAACGVSPGPRARGARPGS